MLLFSEFSTHFWWLQSLRHLIVRNFLLHTPVQKLPGLLCVFSEINPFSNSTPSILLHLCLVTKRRNAMGNALSGLGSTTRVPLSWFFIFSQDFSRSLPVQHSTQFLSPVRSQQSRSLQDYLCCGPFLTWWFDHFKVQLSSQVLNVIDQNQIHLNSWQFRLGRCCIHISLEPPAIAAWFRSNLGLWSSFVNDISPKLNYGILMSPAIAS